MTAGLITKQEDNPFWVTMRDVAEDTAGDDNVELLTATGKSDVDNASQVAALEEHDREGGEGHPHRARRLDRHRARDREGARQAGVTVIAVDTPTRPESATDALFATNNAQAGELIGRYARGKAEEDGIEPKIAMLDLAPGITSGVLRHDGFLQGFGIREGDPQIVGSVDTEGNEAKAQGGHGAAAEAGSRTSTSSTRSTSRRPSEPSPRWRRRARPRTT